MAKDKKGKSAGKTAKIAEKKQKQAKKSEKKQNNARLDDSDAEDIDLDAVLAEYERKQREFLNVTETVSAPPRARASATVVGSPTNTNELFVFGGEYFNGAVATFFNDLYVYIIDKDEWRQITSQNTPLPRSGHAWCRGGNAGGIWLFGGEFSSPKQGVFYHYHDFYNLDPATREWSRVETKKGPPSRSGHRMTYHKNYIILFGGFQDTAQHTKYLGDLWIYNTQTFSWHSPILPPASQKPEPRSSFSFLPHESGAVLYGGYSRVKSAVSVTTKTKGGASSQRNILKPLVHTDCWFLRITPPAAGSPLDTPPTVRWERRKKPANAPNPPRAGSTMAYHKGRGIAFGGVYDVEENEEGIDSEFFNTLFTWNIERNRYFPLQLRKPRTVNKRQQAGPARGGRRDRGQAKEDDLLRNLAALEAGHSVADADDVPKNTEDAEEEASQMPIKTVTMDLPHPRFNCSLATVDDTLFMFGGTFEKGDREYTFDEMYAIDLGKLDGVKEIFRREPENWLGSDDEDDADGSDESEDDEDEDGSRDEDEVVGLDGEESTSIREKSKAQPSSRKSKQKVENGIDDIKGLPSIADLALEENDIETSDPVSVDDGQPYPRPFESRREFFVRTSNEWQEILMTSLRLKGKSVESLGVKEIKSKAFEMSEEKWWDCREEITALEDEQEEKGIGDTVNLTERGDGGGAGRRR